MHKTQERGTHSWILLRQSKGWATSLVHLLLSEPERGKLSLLIQMLKQITSRKLKLPDQPRFWQVRYYDFPVWSEAKRIEKLRYIHRNPVKRGLVERPEDWKCSSFVHYATGTEGTVEIESQWTARGREQTGVVPLARAHPPANNAGRVGQPSREVLIRKHGPAPTDGTFPFIDEDGNK